MQPVLGAAAGCHYLELVRDAAQDDLVEVHHGRLADEVPSTTNCSCKGT
jgi:hypothetical protein